MPLAYVLGCLFSATCFGGWVVLARYARLPDPWVTMGINVLTLAASAALVSHRLRDQVPTGTQWGWLLVIGLANGCGFVLFSYMIGLGQVEISRLSVVLNVGIISVGVVGGILLLKEPFTWRKLASVAFAVIAIYLAAGKTGDG